MKKIVLILSIALSVIFVLQSCSKKNEKQETENLVEVKFDFNKYHNFSNQLTSQNFKFKINDFADFKQKFIPAVNKNFKSGNDDVEITEEQWQQIQNYLNQLGFFDTNPNINTIQDNYFDFLFQNNIISNSTYTFINTSIPDYTNPNPNLASLISDYENNNNLSNTEITILDNLSYWVESTNNKSIGCNLGCSVWGGLWGLGASVLGPWTGFAVGVYASATCGIVCESV